MHNLTAFQRDILYITATEPEQPGNQLRDALTDYYTNDLNHSRFYQAVNQLVDRGLIEKGFIDGRTNSYTLTSEAREMLRDRTEWEYQHLNGMNDE